MRRQDTVNVTPPALTVRALRMQVPKDLSEIIEEPPLNFRISSKLIGRLFLFYGKPNSEFRSRARRSCLNLNPALVMIHNLLHDCQTQAGSRRAGLARRPATVEPLKQMRHILCTDPQARVLNA